MPNIDNIGKLKINIYYGDHLPPHIHAVYNDYEALIEIDTLNIYAGSLPKSELKNAMNWIKQYQDYAKDIFYKFNPNLIQRKNANKKNKKNK